MISSSLFFYTENCVIHLVTDLCCDKIKCSYLFRQLEKQHC